MGERSVALNCSPSPCGRGLGGGGVGTAGEAPSPQPPPARGGGDFVGAVVIGIGNPDRGDDGVGRLVARLLGGAEHGGEATSLLAMLEGVDRAWLIDAAQSGVPVGTIHRIDCATDRVPSRADVSSHGFGVVQAIELGRALGTLPRQCVLFAIEAGEFTAGAALSPAVERAAHEVARRIRAELATCHGRA